MIYLESHRNFKRQPLYKVGERVFVNGTFDLGLDKYNPPGSGANGFITLENKLGTILNVKRTSTRPSAMLEDRETDFQYTIEFEFHEPDSKYYRPNDTFTLKVYENPYWHNIVCSENSEQGQLIKAEKQGSKFGI